MSFVFTHKFANSMISNLIFLAGILHPLTRIGKGNLKKCLLPHKVCDRLCAISESSPHQKVVLKVLIAPCKH